MQFFDSFNSLGYSAINLVLIFAVVIAIIFRSLGLHTRPVRVQMAGLLVLLLVFSVPFVLTVNFLASENQRLNEAIREDGGLKRTDER